MTRGDRVAGIIRDVLGEQPAAVAHVPTLEDSDVFRARLASGDVFFKAEHEGHPIAVAAWAYGKAAELGVPAPDVLHLDLSRKRWPRAFLLMTAVAGSDLEHDPLEGAKLIRALEGYGDLLRRLHTVRTEGFGYLKFRSATDADPVGPFSDHAERVRAGPGWGLGYLTERRLVDEATVDLIHEVVARHEELFAGPDQGVLVHGDPGLDHLFVERDGMTITGLIDSEPRSADPMWDIAAFSFHYPELVGHLLGGYGRCPDDVALRCEVYGLVRAIGCARWDHERGFDIARPLHEIDRRCIHLKGLLD